MEEHCHCGFEVNMVLIGATLILVINIKLVHFSMMKDWDVTTLGGLIQEAPIDEKTLLLSLIKRKRSLKRDT